MRRGLLALLLGVILILVGIAVGGRAWADEAPAYVVIVNAKNPYTTLDRNFVGEAFLKKTTRWPNGDVIKPVDLPGGSAVRERFTQGVLRRSVAAVKSYWQQIIFSGRDVPPAELSNEDDIIKYVATHPGAIGYVGGNVRLGETRPVTVRP